MRSPAVRDRSAFYRSLSQRQLIKKKGDEPKDNPAKCASAVSSLPRRNIDKDLKIEVECFRLSFCIYFVFIIQYI